MSIKTCSIPRPRETPFPISPSGEIATHHGKTITKDDKIKESPSNLIAIIIDDWGYNAHHCDQLATIPAPVAISVLPNIVHSTFIAQCAHQNNKEVILHLPLEPYENLERYPENYIIKGKERIPDKAVSLSGQLSGLVFTVFNGRLRFRFNLYISFRVRWRQSPSFKLPSLRGP